MAHHVIGVFGREMQISLTVIAKHPHREQFGDKLALDVHLPRAEKQEGEEFKNRNYYLFVYEQKSGAQFHAGGLEDRCRRGESPGE